ncbi:hypothetical protein [Cohnella phaseoli]|uniref:Uncharacterized protein n=1 Tax=Cohnella phaseoli TaxID=456490 RepID=A0A3D9JPC3_9BACL|nr:hypothetical protein [Cohnella phaseoli]RED75963.1 hypothetical protein DFP98_11323 [Cohnella phaseoli]
MIGLKLVLSICLLVIVLIAFFAFCLHRWHVRKWEVLSESGEQIEENERRAILQHRKEKIKQEAMDLGQTYQSAPRTVCKEPENWTNVEQCDVEHENSNQERWDSVQLQKENMVANRLKGVLDSKNVIEEPVDITRSPSKMSTLKLADLPSEDFLKLLKIEKGNMEILDEESVITFGKSISSKRKVWEEGQHVVHCRIIDSDQIDLVVCEEISTGFSFVLQHAEFERMGIGDLFTAQIDVLGKEKQWKEVIQVWPGINDADLTEAGAS